MSSSSLSSSSSDVATDSDEDLNPRPETATILGKLTKTASSVRKQRLPTTTRTITSTPPLPPPTAESTTAIVTLVVRNASRDGAFVRPLFADPYVIVPTSARNRHCGADALRILLSTTSINLGLGAAAIARCITDQLPTDFATSFRVEHGRVVTRGDEDLLDAHYEADFADNQLAGGLRELSAGRYVLGVVDMSVCGQVSRNHGDAFVQWSSAGDDAGRVQDSGVSSGRAAELAWKGEPEALWVRNTGGHWEALVPVGKATVAMRRKGRVVRFEPAEDNSSDDGEAYEGGEEVSATSCSGVEQEEAGGQVSSRSSDSDALDGHDEDDGDDEEEDEDETSSCEGCPWHD